MSVKYCIFHPSLVRVLSTSHVHIICFTMRFYPSIALTDYQIIIAYNFVLTHKITSFLCIIAMDVEFWAKSTTHLHLEKFGRGRYKVVFFHKSGYLYCIFLCNFSCVGGPCDCPSLPASVLRHQEEISIKEVTWRNLSEENLGRVEEFQNRRRRI